jgi:hypothetical protein
MAEYDYDPTEWVKDLRRGVGDKLMRDIVNDFRSYNPSPRSPLNSPPATANPVDAAPVKTGDVGPQHRPIDRSGWRDPPKVDQWKPPGLEHMDRMMDQQDAIDRAARARELASAAAVKRAEAAIKEQPKEKERKDREEE